MGGTNMTMITILIVEDEGIVAEEIKSRLRHRGYEVTAIVASGEDAVAKAEEARPDLVLMDIKLRGEMDGIEAAKEIRSRFDIPVIYLTAYADEDTLHRAKVTEPFGYILKPFEERELHTSIEMGLYKHKMEKKLRESEENYCSLFDNAILGIYRITSSDNIVMANPAFVAMLGYSSFEELTQHCQLGGDIYSPKIPRSEITQLVEREGKVMGIESAWEKKDGTTVFTRENVKVVRDETGTVRYYEGIVEDITERKRAEEEKRMTQQLLSKTLSDLSDAVLIIDTETAEVTYCNTAASDVFGEIEVAHSTADESLIIISSRSKT